MEKVAMALDMNLFLYILGVQLYIRQIPIEPLEILILLILIILQN